MKERFIIFKLILEIKRRNSGSFSYLQLFKLALATLSRELDWMNQIDEKDKTDVRFHTSFTEGAQA
jgi:hypothetical protein|tara:strand:+ start:287 stop:484 length:198 start_codon:yes stop_codon:yes gene_type:complete